MKTYGGNLANSTHFCPWHQIGFSSPPFFTPVSIGYEAQWTPDLIFTPLKTL